MGTTLDHDGSVALVRRRGAFATIPAAAARPLTAAAAGRLPARRGLGCRASRRAGRVGPGNAGIGRMVGNRPRRHLYWMPAATANIPAQGMPNDGILPPLAHDQSRQPTGPPPPRGEMLMNRWLKSLPQGKSFSPLALRTGRAATLLLAAVVLTTLPCGGEEHFGYTDTPMLPNSKWRVHDKMRPQPPMVAPGRRVRRPARRRHHPLRRQGPFAMGGRQSAGIENGVIDISRDRRALHPRGTSAIANSTSNGPRPPRPTAGR